MASFCISVHLKVSDVGTLYTASVSAGTLRFERSSGHTGGRAVCVNSTRGAMAATATGRLAPPACRARHGHRVRVVCASSRDELRKRAEERLRRSVEGWTPGARTPGRVGNGTSGAYMMERVAERAARNGADVGTPAELYDAVYDTPWLEDRGLVDGVADWCAVMSETCDVAGVVRGCGEGRALEGLAYAVVCGGPLRRRKR